MNFAALDPIRVGEPTGIFQNWKGADRQIEMLSVEDARKALGLTGKSRVILPPEVRLFGEFMLRQNARKLTARDVVKAYVLTMSSIQRQGIAATTALMSKGGVLLWPDPPEPKPVLTEERLPGRPPRTFEAYTTLRKKGARVVQSEPKVRPETYMAALLLSSTGTRYLDAAERGLFDHEAALALSRAHQRFGKSGLNEYGAPTADPRAEGLYQQLQYAVALAQRHNEVAAALRNLPARDWSAWVRKNLRGVGPAKVGFIAALLGRGDLPTADAREIQFWWTNWRDFSSQKMKDGVPQFDKDGNPKWSAPTVKPEFVDTLAARLKALNVQMPNALRKHYQHLVHHMVWDAAGGSHTTHADLISAMDLAGIRRRGGRFPG